MFDVSFIGVIRLPPFFAFPWVFKAEPPRDWERDWERELERELERDWERELERDGARDEPATQGCGLDFKA